MALANSLDHLLQDLKGLWEAIRRFYAELRFNRLGSTREGLNTDRIILDQFLESRALWPHLFTAFIQCLT